MKRLILVSVVLLLLLSALAGCARKKEQATPLPAGALPADAMAIAQERGLTPDDIAAALKTYMPSGKWDEYYLFSSGGHSGNLIVIGVPSMRILKNIAVFTPEAWQGYGYGDKATEEILDAGNVGDVKIRMGDSHHPALSETNGDYDGQWVFINDKANARVAVIDLRDFRTKQIVKDPNIISNHGSTFVTPNTEYVIQGTQYATPLGWDYAPLSEYKEKYRGVITLWKFDREKGRIVPEESFSIEVPPYWQDLCDAGKLASDGWAFCNSFNTELFTGGNMQGNPQFESGVSQRDMDYLHIFNWRKAAEVVAAGKYEVINGMRVIRLPTAAAEGILFFAPEPKSPHGVDVTPDGQYVVVSGKLDPHVTVYSMAKIEKAIADRNWTLDDYGVPVLNYDAVMHVQVELGLGPLHTQFDGQGYAYTSLFLDSAIARWKLGGDDPAAWTLVEKTPVHYNVGHIAAAEGDTVNPDGKYLVALNKWAVDRFLPVGPLLPQNLQLLDISGSPVKLIYDMPMGIGEPHYAQMIKADKLKPLNVYPQVGWDAIEWKPSPYATKKGEERIERNGNHVTIYSTSIRSHITPDRVELKKGDHVTWHITNVETAHDAVHGFQLGGQNISLSIEPGATVTFEFVASQDGTYAYYCTEFCSALHLEMMGYMLVEP
ncbi:MAG: Sec-dependent nitrous-oxide reductase [Caldilineales bacterium]|nr:Sec-dependent nitrous-oxide reductase [Caldilineales bacterium]MDW8318464.1 Sec-dependent nitrous-oxide reductase [Anaerolineae bacterium]